ncbi:MAG: NRDE family protein [Desulfobacteraceae bacterium]
MCLILMAMDSHPQYKLILAANRDEYYDRPTARAAFWQEAPDVIAGRDLQGGGTWMGVTRTGRICAITNHRDPTRVRKNVPSRGRLVSGFLLGGETPREYLKGVFQEGDTYNGFNLIAGMGADLYWTSNRSEKGVKRLERGIHGLSNHLLDTPWPKVQRGKAELERVLARHDSPLEEALFSLLRDQKKPPDSQLPDTGVGLEWERVLSPSFIQSPRYGTRSSTLVLIGRDDRVRFIEHSHDDSSREAPVVSHTFSLQTGGRSGSV